GHILGLGDRHLSNILMDAKTGEVIHIDLGVAFDQGKLLAIPELVPFRLTPDIVDGLGIAGTEGVFRRCCEEALRALREGSDTIKTVLEVFKYDPLHQWAVAPGKLRRIQDMDDDGNDIEGAKGLPSSEPQVQGADRAISSVAGKLDTSLSVEYTVNDLIVTARNPANLSRLFVGILVTDVVFDVSDMVFPRKEIRTLADMPLLRARGLRFRTDPVARSNISNGVTVAGIFCA
ncbi:9650_t:CDS:2, partial [Acaulospora colombiana]